jgi:hypothetical protein
VAAYAPTGADGAAEHKEEAVVVAASKNHPSRPARAGKSAPRADAGAHCSSRPSDVRLHVRDLHVDSQRDRSRRGRGQPPEQGRAPCPSRCRIRPLVC